MFQLLYLDSNMQHHLLHDHTSNKTMGVAGQLVLYCTINHVSKSKSNDITGSRKRKDLLQSSDTGRKKSAVKKEQCWRKEDHTINITTCFIANIHNTDIHVWITI